MTEPPAVAIFLDRIADELVRLKNQTEVVRDSSDVDLTRLIRALKSAIAEARKQSKPG